MGGAPIYRVEPYHVVDLSSNEITGLTYRSIVDEIPYFYGFLAVVVG